MSLLDSFNNLLKEQGLTMKDIVSVNKVQYKPSYAYLMKLAIEETYGRPIQQISDEEIQKFIDLTKTN